MISIELKNAWEMIKQDAGSIASCNELSEQMMWSVHGPAVWKADRFAGSPSFYPVYRYRNFYSYSPLSLILLKGGLRLNHRVAKRVSMPNYRYYSGKDTLDREITRIGGPPKPGCVIKDPDRYAHNIAQAMCEDTQAVESNHPGFTNIILCGGKDSLNLTLLPWSNSTILASAPPNYDLVKKFVTDNGLKYDVIALDDRDTSILHLEVLVNCCRNNLQHCRWGSQLRDLSRTLRGKVIFWKGQLGSPIMTPYWKTFKHSPNVVSKTIPRFYKIAKRYGQYPLKCLLGKNRFAQRYFFKSLWYRGAMWQGAHVSIIRQLTDVLTVSGYHGPAMQKVLSQVDLHAAVQTDIRPLVGRYLRGSPVLYPSTNPTPPLNELRKGMSHVEPFLKALSSFGIPVQEN